MKTIEYNSNIRFYIIFDTNWLLNMEGTTFIVPKSPVYSKPFFPWSEKELLSYVCFPVEIIIPKQVKAEIAKLHEEKADHAKTANAKRHYASLQRYFGLPVKQFVNARPYLVDYRYDEFLSKEPLLTLSEVDLTHVPAAAIRESQLGPDSNVDKGIISLAHDICRSNPMNHCFVASYDTGIQAEVSNLFYREKMKIGCPSFLDEWTALLDQSANKLAQQGGGGDAEEAV